MFSLFGALYCCVYRGNCLADETLLCPSKHNSGCKPFLMTALLSQISPDTNSPQYGSFIILVLRMSVEYYLGVVLR